MPEFPSTHDDLSAYNKSVKQRIEKKYETLIKNVHFYLCYLFLEVADYRNCIKHGEVLIGDFSGRLTTKTTFSVMQYLAEAYCMNGNYQDALALIEDSDQLQKQNGK